MTVRVHEVSDYELLLTRIRALSRIFNVRTADEVIALLDAGNLTAAWEYLTVEGDVHSSAGNAGRAESFRELADECWKRMLP